MIWVDTYDQPWVEWVFAGSITAPGSSNDNVKLIAQSASYGEFYIATAQLINPTLSAVSTQGYSEDGSGNILMDWGTPGQLLNAGQRKSFPGLATDGTSGAHGPSGFGGSQQISYGQKFILLASTLPAGRELDFALKGWCLNGPPNISFSSTTGSATSTISNSFAPPTP